MVTSITDSVGQPISSQPSPELDPEKVAHSIQFLMSTYMSRPTSDDIASGEQLYQEAVLDGISKDRLFSVNIWASTWGLLGYIDHLQARIEVLENAIQSNPK